MCQNCIWSVAEKEDGITISEYCAYFEKTGKTPERTDSGCKTHEEKDYK